MQHLALAWMLCLGIASALPLQQQSEDTHIIEHGAANSTSYLHRSTLAGVRKLYNTPAAQLSLTATLELDRVGVTVPQSFLGISCEWIDIDMLGAHPDYITLLRKLSSYGGGPLSVRIGGGSTDMLMDVPGQNVWKALSDVQYQLGVNYIVGLNFMHMDIGLARRQMQAAQAGLPKGSIIAFELGNEPNYYIGVHGKSPNEYTACCLIPDWQRFAQSLSCPSSGSCTNYQFAGPAWGHIAMRPDSADWFMRVNWPWTKMFTIHWYKAAKEAGTTAEGLLDETSMRNDINSLRSVISVATSKWNKPVRVAEMNTLSNSGLRGVSDSFSAALWTLDGALEVAFTGAIGVNFHQGSGHNLYSAYIRPSNRPAQAPYVRPPFYAYLLFQMAVRGGSRFVGKVVQGPSQVKIHPLQDVSSGALRVVVINKDASKAASVTLRIKGRSSGFGTATITRMVAAGDAPLRATGGITIGGLSYGHQGAAMNGAKAIEYAGAKVVGGMVTWQVYMPPGSAALLEIPKQ